MAHLRHTTLPVYPISAVAMERQHRWELEAIDRGVRRYRDALRRSIEQGAAGETAPGIKITRDVMKSLVPAVAAAQTEARTKIATGGRGRPSEWWWLLNLISAEQMAVIVVKAILNEKPTESTVNRPFTGVASSIGNMVRQQVDFETWKEAEREASKRAREEGDYNHVNFYDQLVRQITKPNAGSFRRWSSKIKRLRTEPWTKAQKIGAGEKLLHLLVEHGGGWFRVVSTTIRGKTHRQVSLSPAALEAIADINERSELSAPLHLPMKCPPRAWVAA